jgi:GTP pyrophosphokinase
MNEYLNHCQFLDLLRGHMNPEGLELVEDAYNLSKYAHRAQHRDSGERYFEHPKGVAVIVVSELGYYNPAVLVMALLHDVIEDSFIVTRSGMARLFGKRISQGLDYLTKTENHDEYVGKMYECQDIGVIIVKLADRLHNLRDMSGVTAEKKVRKFAETRALYLELADHFIEKATGAELAALQQLRDAIAAIIA